MKYKIGDIVSLTNNKSKKFVIVKSRFENLTEDNFREISVKTNILGLKDKISNVEIGVFDYLLIESVPLPFPREMENPNYELVTIDDINNNI